jgi:flagellar motor protein MotB
MRRLLQEDDPPPAAPAWALSFGDMMALLLAMFVLVASMSEVKEDYKFRAMADSLRERFGGEVSQASLLGGLARRESASLAKLAALGRTQRAAALGAGDKVRPTGSEMPQTPP